MTDPRDDYGLAIKAYDEIDEGFRELAEFLQAAVRKINERPHVTFVVIPDSEGRMPIVTGDNANAIDGRKWPTAEALKTLIENRKAACTKIRNCWSQIPQEQRGQMNQHPCAR